jgi:hypothetical protein
MTFKRIVAFGCSNTVGEYLPGWQDATIENNWQTKLSDDAWPFVLARKMAISQVDNLAWGGLSNHEILHRILSANLSKDDLVVISWTYAGREILFHDKNVTTQTMWDVNGKGEMFYAVHDLIDLEIRSMEYVHHAQMYLENLGIKYAMAQVELWESTPQWPKYNKEDFVYYKFIDQGSDNAHPGVESHKLIAELMYKRIYQ